jgi:hypothetical protein
MTEHQHKKPEHLSAGALRAVADAFAHARVHGSDDRRHEAERQIEQVRAAIEHHTTDAVWRDLLNRARQAAAHCEHESLLLKFHASECSDGGRAINVGDPSWPSTLAGKAADIYRIWHDQLQPRGFGILARILEYPHGNLGEAGLFLSWAKQA